jgi:hypothetical protein
MKTKTINQQLTKKINEWLKTIPEPLRKEIKDSIIVTGGCIVSMLTQTKVNDYDVYISDIDSLFKIMNHYTAKMKSHNIMIQAQTKNSDKWEYITGSATGAVRLRYMIKSVGIVKFPRANNKKPGKEDCYMPAVVTDNALSLTNGIQIINRFWGSPEEIHKNFDFVHVTSYWTYKTGLVTPAEALECILTKELRYRGSLYPLSSIIRIRKFLQRGYTINAGEIVKMALQVSKLNLENIEVLTEQLIGVDSAYFMMFISRLKEEQEKRGSLSMTYVFELLDEVFKMDASAEDSEEKSEEEETDDFEI